MTFVDAVKKAKAQNAPFRQKTTQDGGEEHWHWIDTDDEIVYGHIDPETGKKRISESASFTPFEVLASDWVVGKPFTKKRRAAK